MNYSEKQEKHFFYFKIIQSGEDIGVPLTEKNLKKEFKELYFSLLKQLKLKQKNVYLSNDEGKMIGVYDLTLSLEDIIKKFGIKLKLYYEKVF